jgi:hypothetical protein
MDLPLSVPVRPRSVGPDTVQDPQSVLPYGQETIGQDFLMNLLEAANQHPAHTTLHEGAINTTESGNALLTGQQPAATGSDLPPFEYIATGVISIDERQNHAADGGQVVMSSIAPLALMPASVLTSKPVPAMSTGLLDTESVAEPKGVSPSGESRPVAVTMMGAPFVMSGSAEAWRLESLNNTHIATADTPGLSDDIVRTVLSGFSTSGILTESETADSNLNNISGLTEMYRNNLPVSASNRGLPAENPGYQKPDIPLLLDFNHADRDRMLADRIIWQVNKQMSSASIMLDPPELGPLQINVRMHLAQASIHLIPLHREVRDALESGIPQLRDALGLAGVEHADISVGQPQDQAGYQRHADMGFWSTGSESQAGQTLSSENAITIPDRVHEGLIDCYV